MRADMHSMDGFVESWTQPAKGASTSHMHAVRAAHGYMYKDMFLLALAYMVSRAE